MSPRPKTLHHRTIKQTAQNTLKKFGPLLFTGLVAVAEHHLLKKDEEEEDTSLSNKEEREEERERDDRSSIRELKEQVVRLRRKLKRRERRGDDDLEEGGVLKEGRRAVGEEWRVREERKVEERRVYDERRPDIGIRDDIPIPRHAAEYVRAPPTEYVQPTTVPRREYRSTPIAQSSRVPFNINDLAPQQIYKPPTLHQEREQNQDLQRQPFPRRHVSHRHHRTHHHQRHNHHRRHSTHTYTPSHNHSHAIDTATPIALLAGALETLHIAPYPGDWLGPKGVRVGTTMAASFGAGYTREREREREGTERDGGDGSVRRRDVLLDVGTGLLVNRLVNGRSALLDNEDEGRRRRRRWSWT